MDTKVTASQQFLDVPGAEPGQNLDAPPWATSLRSRDHTASALAMEAYRRVITPV
ncbi:hypothetical protein [Microbacterium aurum]|nr:hypothetical protein [Microbacterium hominis]